MTKERRVQERFFLNLKARLSYRFTEDQENPVIETVAANISAGGAFLETPQSPPLASKVRVEFLLSFEDLKKLKFILSMESLKKLSGKEVWVVATGVVIRQQENGIGVIFDQNYQLTPMQPVDT